MYMLGPNYHELNRLEASNEFELQTQIRNVLRLLRPQRAIGVPKGRFGCEGDGGYVHLDDFDGVDTAISLGIDHNITWDRDIADRGLTVYQYDGTVEDPAPDDPRMIFSKTMIGTEARPGFETLESIISRLDKGEARPNIILKMDIECAEWATIEAISLDALARFSQITCELHNFGSFDRLEWRQGFFRSLRKLMKLYAPVHIHANNFAGWATVANIPIPHVLEVSFANRAIYQFEDSDELFPGPLDSPCNTRIPDMYLGNFVY
jgi:hypothetical protein